MLQHTSSLALRALLKAAASRGGLDRARPALTGLSPAAMAFHAAVAAEDAPSLLVVPTDAAVEQMTADARFFLANVSRPDAGRRRAGRPAVPVAGSRSVPRPASRISTSRRRAPPRCTASRPAPRGWSWRRRGRCCRACPIPAASRLAGVSARARADEIAPRDLGARLVLAGFSPEDPVDEHGEFCVRGGIVDFYPASEAQPVRLEFVGDIIESIRRFDAATQRSLTALDRVTVTPQRELLPDESQPGRSRRVRPVGHHHRLRPPRRRRAHRVRAGRCGGAGDSAGAAVAQDRGRPDRARTRRCPRSTRSRWPGRRSSDGSPPAGA